MKALLVFAVLVGLSSAEVLVGGTTEIPIDSQLTVRIFFNCLTILAGCLMCVGGGGIYDGSNNLPTRRSCSNPDVEFTTLKKISK